MKRVIKKTNFQLVLNSLLVCAFLMGACSTTEKEDVTPVDQVLKSDIVESNNSFSFNIFNEIVSNEATDKNVFISPLSMYYALSMAGNGANGDTYLAFSDVLGWDSYEKQSVLNSMKVLFDELIPNNPEVVVEIANSLWPNENFYVKEDFISESQNYFNAEVKTLNFLAPGAVDLINDWIADKTDDKITDMLDQISPDAVLYIINAIYFNAIWKYQFEDTSNYQAPFLKIDDTHQDVTFMQQKAPLKYLYTDDFSSVKLPYVDSNYIMTVYLPNQGSSTNSFLEEFTAQNWKLWNDSFEYKDVTLSLPKFKFVFGTRLINKELIDLGLGIAFSPALADFSNITDQQIFISRVLHKAFVEVNEEGTEAAAATIIEFENTSIEPNQVTLSINRPFIFTITEEKSQSLLFMGRVAFPEYEE